ncbi:MAG: hypothetical protein ACE5JS_03815 [Nitrospinota bacterium]
MTSLDNLQRLEEQIRALLAERDDLKSRVEQLEAGGPGRSGEEGPEERDRADDLLMRERQGVRDRVESLLATLSQMSRAG